MGAVFIRMAKEGFVGVSSLIRLLIFFLSISLTASQSVPPYYAGSYLEASSGQERGAEDGNGGGGGGGGGAGLLGLLGLGAASAGAIGLGVLVLAAAGAGGAGVVAVVANNMEV